MCTNSPAIDDPLRFFSEICEVAALLLPSDVKVQTLVSIECTGWLASCQGGFGPWNRLSILTGPDRDWARLDPIVDDVLSWIRGRRAARQLWSGHGARRLLRVQRPESSGGGGEWCDNGQEVTPCGMPCCLGCPRKMTKERAPGCPARRASSHLYRPALRASSPISPAMSRQCASWRVSPSCSTAASNAACNCSQER